MDLGIHLGKVVSGGLKMLDKGFSFKKVDPLTHSIRMATCKGCTNYDPENRACKICKCPLDFKTSLYNDPIKSAALGRPVKNECPDKKWLN